MIVYFVEASKGNYDDLCNWIHKAFFNKEKAEFYISKKNLQLERCKILADLLWLEDEELKEFNLEINREYKDRIYEGNWQRYSDILEKGKFIIKEINVE